MTKFRIITLLTVLLCFVACRPDSNDSVCERDITYTVAGKTTTVHLNTESEFDALLERFCDYAESGSEVTFYNANRVAKGAAAKETLTYSTTSRNEIKRWMARMEDAGKTVTVTYDSRTGTWTGTAYATAPQRSDCYTGVIVAVPNPQMSAANPCEPTLVFALQLNADTNMIISLNGAWFCWNDGIGLEIENVTYNLGDTVTLCGTMQVVLDYSRTPVLLLEIGEVQPYDNYITTYLCDRWPDYMALVTVDLFTCQIYGTWAVDAEGFFPWGICGYTTSGEPCLDCIRGFHFTNIYWNGTDCEGEYRLSGDTLHVQCSSPMSEYCDLVGSFDFVRSTLYETWVSTNNGYDVVMHIDRANHRAVASTPQGYINTVVGFPNGRFDYEERNVGSALYVGADNGYDYEISRNSYTQEVWRLASDSIYSQTFVFNRVN